MTALLKPGEFDPAQKPYIVESEGKLAGQSPSKWAFYQLNKLDNIVCGLRKEGVCRYGGNEYYDSMLWAAERIQMVFPTQPCPFCGEYPVEYMSVIYTSGGISVGTSYTACEHCRPKLEELHPEGQNIFKIRWTVQRNFRAHARKRGGGYTDGERNSIRDVLRYAFEMPKHLSISDAHEILAKGEVPERMRPKRSLVVVNVPEGDQPSQFSEHIRLKSGRVTTTKGMCQLFDTSVI